MMVYSWSPSATSSFTPETVTVCTVAQFAGVNVSVPEAGTVTSPSAGSLDVTEMVTS